MQATSTSSTTYSGGVASSSYEQQTADYQGFGIPSSGTGVRPGVLNAQSTQHQGARPKMLSPLNPPTPAIEAIPEICTYNLWGGKFHSDQPYQRKTGEREWENVSEWLNQHLEAHYCNPDVALVCQLEKNCHMDMKTLQMKYRDQIVSQLRLLTTVSSVMVPKHHKFTTQWIWWWFDNGNRWTEYNVYLEKKYQENNTAVINFRSLDDRFLYELNFGSMTRTNIQSGTIRDVCRRPREWSAENSRTWSEENKSRKAVDKIPAHWNTTYPGSNVFYQLVPVTLFDRRRTNKEFTDVEDLFQETMPGIAISKLYRIQNLELWECYERKKSWMQKRGQKPNEKTLFHGTDDRDIDAICQQGFDCRLRGLRSDAVYGKGSYFARDAKLAQQYSTYGELFVVRVLAGEYCEGHPSHMRPPPKDPSKPNENLYDSCVDDIRSPEIYVLFKQEQSYPEYLVQY